jgi:hypothetical protein
MNINTMDTIKCIIRGYIYQVISTTNILIYYLINKDKDTTPTFVICRIIEELYRPRVKMRHKTKHSRSHRWIFRRSCMCAYTYMEMWPNTYTPGSLRLLFDACKTWSSNWLSCFHVGLNVY